MRAKIPVFATVGSMLALGLTACTSAPADESAACHPAVSPGAVSEQVRIVGDSDSFPNSISVPALSAKHMQASVAQGGHGDVAAKAGDIVSVRMAQYDAKTGQRVKAQGEKDSGSVGFLPVVSADSEVTTLGSVLTCARPGDRVVVAHTADTTQQIISAFGVPAENQLITVLDVQGVEGVSSDSTRALPNGFPAVSVLPDGTPGFVFPPSEGPAKLQSAAFSEGDGATVKDGEQLVLQVQTANWDGSQALGQKWADGPFLFGNSSNGKDAPVRKALNGHRVGSLVVIVEPATDAQPARAYAVKILGASS